MNEQLWQSVLGEIELSVSRGSFVTWFKSTVLISHDDGDVVIGVPNIFAKQQLDTKFKQLVTDTIARNGIEPKTVTFKIHSMIKPRPSKDSAGDSLSATPSAGPAPANKAAPSISSGPAPVTMKTNKQGLNEKYVFDSFIVGGSNELAHAACQAIAANPGQKYNPLFVYGGVGLGKTHLIQAVGNQVLKDNPDAKVAYITSEQFVKEFLDSIRYKKKGFSEKYRSVDVLIVDDLQFIAGKEKTQEEFFHTFNALHQANKQIVLSSDKPPKSIPTLEDRLRSRFEMGMTVDIQMPDFETRSAIIQTKASQHNITLDPETVEYLATHVQSNVRELEGALNQLLAMAEMRNQVPDKEMAAGLLSNNRARPKHITPKQVIERCARHFQIEMEEITGPKRDKDIVVPRQIAMYLLRSELHLSFPKVARELGRKDHTTAIHSVDKIEKSMAFDQSIRQHITEIKERLYA